MCSTSNKYDERKKKDIGTSEEEELRTPRKKRKPNNDIITTDKSNDKNSTDYTLYTSKQGDKIAPNAVFYVDEDSKIIYDKDKVETLVEMEKNEYDEVFNCTFCNKAFGKKRYAVDHVKQSHLEVTTGRELAVSK